jgi:hypothetical protein
MSKPKYTPPSTEGVFSPTLAEEIVDNAMAEYKQKVILWWETLTLKEKRDEWEKDSSLSFYVNEPHLTTPTPWKVDYDNSETCQWHTAGPAKIEFGWNAKEAEEKAKLDAELIVKAVNCHNEIVGVLSYIKSQIDEYGCDERMGEDIKERVFNALKKANNV